MFVIDPDKYRVISIEDHEDDSTGKTTNAWIDVNAILIWTPRKCLVKECPDAVVYSQDKPFKNVHELYGLYKAQPCRYHIARERFKCLECKSTFFADYGREDFGEKEHTLPEFIKYLIKEWLISKDDSFYTIAKRYGLSRETVRQWCGMLVNEFDYKARCNADAIMHFLPFTYTWDNTDRIHAVVYKSMVRSDRVCAFIDDYNCLDTDGLRKQLERRFCRLYYIEKVYYGYIPKLNKAFEDVGVFSDNVQIIVDKDKLYQDLITMLDKCDPDSDYAYRLKEIFDADTHARPHERLLKLQEWCKGLLPAQVKNTVSAFLNSLINDTPQHFLNIDFSYKENDHLNIRKEWLADIPKYCEKRSRKKEPYESIKLRVLYANEDWKKKIDESLDKYTYRFTEKKRSSETTRVAFALPINDMSGLTDETKQLISVSNKTSIPCKQTTEDMNEIPDSEGMIVDPRTGNKLPYSEWLLIQKEEQSKRASENDNSYVLTERLVDARTAFIDYFDEIDPNILFSLIPKISNWSVNMRRLREVLEDDGDEWLDLDE